MVRARFLMENAEPFELDLDEMPQVRDSFRFRNHTGLYYFARALTWLNEPSGVILQFELDRPKNIDRS